MTTDFPFQADTRLVKGLPVGTRIYRDLRYAGSGNPRQTLDLYLPSEGSEEPVPLVIYVHGGGYVEGDKEEPILLHCVIKEDAYAGASINYRLANEACWPAQMDDLKAAIHWLVEHAGSFGYDADRIVLFGVSAGGQMVSMAGITGPTGRSDHSSATPASRHGRVACIINFAGFANFMNLSQQGCKCIDLYDEKDNICQVFGSTLKEQAGRVRCNAILDQRRLIS